MTRFNEINVDFNSSTVEVGAGLIWDQVYAALGPTGVSVIGGRVPSVGIAGLTLGGGECLLSSESSILLFSYVFRLFIFDGSIWTCGRQRRWI
jgi:FAD/FMN-containing dehydrogenase